MPATHPNPKGKMSDILTTITHLINSPPGQLAAGGVLAGIVWKFFERVEAVLRDDTKKEIAVWLVGVKVGQKVEPWPGTFVKVFDRVFGTEDLSWKRLWRSSVLSTGILALDALWNVLHYPSRRNDRQRLPFGSTVKWASAPGGLDKCRSL